MRRVLILLFFLINWLSGLNQDNSFVFSHLKEKDGLSGNIVNCFLRDSRNILWIGTYNGFNRFDGSNFFAYKKRKGTNSIANEVVHSLCEDRNGNIWGSTDNGVFCFRPMEDIFINYNIRSCGVGKIFYKIFCDKLGNIWAAGEWSVFKFNIAQKKFDEVIILTEHRDSLNFFQIRKNGIQEDPSRNGFWMATRAGIFYYDAEKKEISNYSNKPGDSLFTRRSVSALSMSPSGAMWFFNNNQKEFISFDPATQKLLHRINIGHILPKANGGTILEDRNHRLWFASVTYEVLVVDLQNGNRIHELKHRPDDSRSIANPFFWAALQDEDGTIWLGTGSGVSRCNPEKTIYREFHLPEKIPQLRENSIRIAEEDPSDKSFWLITRSDHLIHYYPDNIKYEVFELSKALPFADSIRPGTVNAIKFLNDRVIITTSTGAWQLKKDSRRIAPYNFFPAGFENFRCTEMLLNGDSVIYFTDGRRLLYWNYLTGKNSLINYSRESVVPSNNTIISGLMLTPGQTLWMISYNNHIAVKDNTNQLLRLKIFKDDIKETGVTLSMDADSEDNIWLLNKGVGLYSYNPGTQVLHFWDETDGLPSNRMQKMKTDPVGRVWCIFYNKVSVFIPGPNKFYNFQVPISESNTNYISHITIRSNGNIFATIDNEIVEFFPERIDEAPGKHQPQISQLSINGRDQQILSNDKIFLQPKQNTIGFRFGILIDKNIYPYDMEYKLEGAEVTWTTSTGSEALYNNLASGTYKFRVRAKGKNNAWQSEEAGLLFTIKTPFYKTTWFLILCAFLFIGSLLFLYRYRLSQKEKFMLLENKAQRLKKEKTLVMYENLKQQLNPHFLFNSLTSLNSLIEAEPKAASEFLDSLSKTYRYILKSRDSETVSLIDEIKFAENYVKLQKTRFEKGFEVSFNVPEELYHRKIVPVTLQNLIENAIKHNVIDEDTPLHVNIYTEGDLLIVQNNLQKKKFVETSNKHGLASMESLYHYLSNRPFGILETEQFFTVKIPLL